MQFYKRNKGMSLFTAREYSPGQEKKKDRKHIYYVLFMKGRIQEG